jgi:CubicO group peptidase (beta-lactamase class C family)
LVLSDLLATLEKRAFRDAVAEGVLMPIGMKPRRANDVHGRFCNADRREIPDIGDGTVGAGGLISSAADFARWDAGLLDGSVYPGESAFVAGQAVAENVSYSRGQEITEDRTRGRVAYHDGEAPGYSAINVLYLNRRASITVLTNCDHLGGLRALADELYDLIP